MNLIDALFQRLRDEKKKAFIPFVTAGDPDLETTSLLVRELAARGASLIEIGFPYSDPIADGAVIQASYTRALAKGIHLDDIYRCVKTLTASEALSKKGVPLVSMVSYSIVHRRGVETFLQQAQDAGFSGAIIPDLPIDESEGVCKLAKALDFKIIHLVTPTTPRERAIQIARATTGFLYCVSVTGITGERDRLPDELLQQLGWLRQQTDLPLCVGFGISKPEHAKMLKPVADGIIVGSAIVRRVEQMGARPARAVVKEIGDMCAELVEALDD